MPPITNTGLRQMFSARRSIHRHWRRLCNGWAWLVALVCVAVVFFPWTDYVNPPRRRVVVDLGANFGNSYADLAGRRWMGRTLRGRISDYEVFLVEPNPRFGPYLTTLVQSEHKRVGHPFIQYLPLAASTSNGSVSFFIDPSLPLAGKYTDKDGYGSGGSSLLGGMPAVDPSNPRNPNLRTRLIRKDAKPELVTVQAFDVVEWLRREIVPGDEVHLKIDVEGMEYELFRKMLPTGVLCNIDHLYVEFHGKAMLASANSSLHRYAGYEKCILWMLRGCPKPPEFHRWS
eukprot:Plantae.Rhodophyta-Rhodochaete_pulchella.ctg5246.p1 GENE.Plantae.Rhodophyta-Rhodochaete_pulchella.ctg5246~~Plantae.Rhodophyta-Rhodochaete_pulchella.ctg5246.p1  ORF type:complete len:287 (+),score=27.85 Plantae.Rhodophyta-Rhodochaete_pulchella.ctg5246:405-1265(+)